MQYKLNFLYDQILLLFQFVLPFCFNEQAPTMGRRATSETVINASVTSDEPNGESTTENRAAPTSAQRLASSAASVTEVAPDPYGREAKHFTETRVLNRDVRFYLLALTDFYFLFTIFLMQFNIQVRIVLEGVDKYSNLIGSVYYPDGESAKDLGLELIENVCDRHITADTLEHVSNKKLKLL